MSEPYKESFDTNYVLSKYKHLGFAKRAIVEYRARKAVKKYRPLFLRELCEIKEESEGPFNESWRYEVPMLGDAISKTIYRIFKDFETASMLGESVEPVNRRNLVEEIHKDLVKYVLDMTMASENAQANIESVKNELNDEIRKVENEKLYT